MSDLDDLATITDAFEVQDRNGLTPKRVRAGKQRYANTMRHGHIKTQSPFGRLKISATKRNAKVTLASKA
jgi:hypothetical protein